MTSKSKINVVGVKKFIKNIPGNVRDTINHMGYNSQTVDVPEVVPRRAFGAFSAESDVNFDNFRPKVVAKPKEVEEQLANCLKKCHMFSFLNKSTIEQLVSSAEPMIVAADEVLIRQGDAGNVLYIVADGSLECFVDRNARASMDHEDVTYGQYKYDKEGARYSLEEAPEGSSFSLPFRSRLDEETPAAITQTVVDDDATDDDSSGNAEETATEKPVYIPSLTIDETTSVCVLGEGAVVGELAVLYISRRAASVRTKTQCTLFALDRMHYNFLVRGPAMTKRNMIVKALSKIPLFSNLSGEQMNCLADCVQSRSVDAGEIVVKEGEVGEEFYMITDGYFAAFKGWDDIDESDLEMWREALVNGTTVDLGDQATVEVDGPISVGVHSAVEDKAETADDDIIDNDNEPSNDIKDEENVNAENNADVTTPSVLMYPADNNGMDNDDEASASSSEMIAIPLPAPQRQNTLKTPSKKGIFGKFAHSVSNITSKVIDAVPFGGSSSPSKLSEVPLAFPVTVTDKASDMGSEDLEDEDDEEVTFSLKGKPERKSFTMPPFFCDEKRSSKVVFHYQEGDYFGELALLHSRPRAATIVSASKSELLVMTVADFKRLMGDEIIESMRNYASTNYAQPKLFTVEATA